jgi:hypothetical protein
LAASAGNQGVTGQHAEQIMFERTNTTKKEEKKDAASAAKVHMVRFSTHFHTRRNGNHQVLVCNNAGSSQHLLLFTHLCIIFNLLSSASKSPASLVRSHVAIW